MINELNDAQMTFSIRELKAMGLSYYQIVKLVNDDRLNKLNRRNYENLNFKGDYNEPVYANVFLPKESCDF